MRSHELVFSHSQSLSSNSQKGSTLIAVLILLILVTVLGVIAMKQGLTSLAISTNSQIQSLLVQTSDTVMNKVATANVASITSVSGVIGAALANATPLQEYVFCFRPTTTDNFGLSLNANIIQGKTTTASDGTSNVVTVDNGGNGFCDLDADFGSGRRATVTQVAITIPTDATNLPPLSGLSHNGTDVSLGSSLPKGFTTQQRVRVTATSILPAFSANSTSSVESDCLQGRISDNTDPSFASVESVTDCLARKGVPANTQVQEFSLRTTLTGP